MSDIDEVLKRLNEDPEFHDRLVRDPKNALDGYRLTGDDLTVLVDRVSEDQDGLDAAGRRASKAGFFALFSRLPPDTPRRSTRD